MSSLLREDSRSSPPQAGTLLSSHQLWTKWSAQDTSHREVLPLPNVASKPSTSTNKGNTATLSLTGTGTPGLQPHNTAVPPATTVAGNAPAGDILDKNVNMEEPHDEEDPSCVMETDTT
ncbi:hypothetical protein PILCRDRAFT_13595 [Piloderma croceum F 1598]|uniref:Uncharacterized protein n=1 Tax=Piloderma croceum (strain F 1598) TaxID=765440 RepID=A0A0C3ANP0_PILCF|nr:hypothetical protein PILCRDRAFT_13595 [Piloderma croceum F 1598]